MHIPDGFVAGSINITTATVAAITLAWAVTKANKKMEEQQIPLLGVTSAFIFAAQMLNFPIGGGTSGHFMGAVLASVLLGPFNAYVVMVLVLVLQCLGFADGGLTSLGSNVFNMAFVGGLGGYLLFIILRKMLPKKRSGFLAAAAVASWSSIVLASAACAVELGVSGTVSLRVVIPVMVGTHAIIGIGEAIVSMTVLSLVLRTRPDLVCTWAPQ